MITVQCQTFFLPMIVRAWSSEPCAYRPFEEIKVADIIGVAGSLGFTPVYPNAVALQREHPVAGQLFFTNDSRLFPAVCRRWLCEYRPSSSIGFVPVYATLKALRKDFSELSYTTARLDMEEFRLPLAGRHSQTDFSEVIAEPPLNPQRRTELISAPNIKGSDGGV